MVISLITIIQRMKDLFYVISKIIDRKEILFLEDNTESHTARKSQEVFVH